MYSAGCSTITECETGQCHEGVLSFFCRKQMRSNLHFVTIEKCIEKSERLIKQEIEGRYLQNDPYKTGNDNF